MAKKFISFLGTGKYDKCQYKFQENIGKEVKYIQDDLIDRFCGDYDENDKVVFFLTSEAKNAHWSTGLENTIKEKNLKCKICPVDIKDSKTESDIWGLFQQIYENIDEYDEIIFDLTHSFRYLPMLFFSILHYASFLKNISVQGIYYGAFDPKSESKVAPIFDLTDSFKVMEWANAADAFVSYGYADKLEKLAKERGKDFIGAGNLAKNISTMSKSIMCSRIPEIVAGKVFDCIDTKISQGAGNLQPAFKPILEKVSDKISGFKRNDASNFIPAVQWSVDHKMVPQGATILQEGFLTYIMCRHVSVADTDILYDRDLRQYVSDRLHRYSEENVSEYKELLDKICKDKFTQDCCEIWKEISQLRNAVNHGGTDKNHQNSSDSLFNQLEKLFKSVKSIVESV